MDLIVIGGWAYGRWASHWPNLQNLPKERTHDHERIRRAMCAPYSGKRADLIVFDDVQDNTPQRKERKPRPYYRQGRW